jgi:hypothetical protein
MMTTRTNRICNHTRIARRPQALARPAPPDTPPGVAAGFWVSVTSSKMLRFSAMVPPRLAQLTYPAARRPSSACDALHHRRSGAPCPFTFLKIRNWTTVTHGAYIPPLSRKARNRIC